MEELQSQTYGSKQIRNICIAFVLILFLVGVGANIVVESQFGMYLQIGAPTHDSPLSCDKEGYLQCTTREGKCTKEQGECVYPETNEDCSVSMFIMRLSQDEQQALKSRYNKELVRLQKQKILEEYCAADMVHLYKAMTDDLYVRTTVFEVVLSIALFTLFYSEILKISHEFAIS